MLEINRPQPANRTYPQSPQRSGRGPLHGTRAAQPASRVRMAMRAAARLGLLALLTACAGLPLAARAADGGPTGIRAEGPGAVFDSVEAAALDALSYAHITATLTDRRRLRVGAIHRVANGYSYAAVKRSTALSPLTVHIVRYRLRAIDVARYIIPPYSRQVHIARLNEEPTRKEKQIVDELDPEHRPLYQLTPSLNVVVYRQGGPSTVIANLKDLAALKTEAAIREVESALVTSGALSAI